MVLESDAIPDMLSAAHTVATAAIADAGIAMSGLGVGAVIADKKAELDGTSEEKGECSVTVGVLPALNKVTNIWMTGSGDIDSVCNVSACHHSVLCRSMSSSTRSRIVHGLHARKCQGRGLRSCLQLLDAAVKQGRDTHTVLAQALLEGAEQRGF